MHFKLPTFQQLQEKNSKTLLHSLNFESFGQVGQIDQKVENLKIEGQRKT